MAVPIHYDGTLKRYAQKLRREMTRQENTLWYQFLRRYPVQFRRQKQFGEFIVDFYCARAKLVVEIDGSQHYEADKKAEDEMRTAELNEMGLQVIRFSNYDVDVHFESVCAAIDEAVQKGIIDA